MSSSTAMLSRIAPTRLGAAAAVLLLLAGCATGLPKGQERIFDGSYVGTAMPTDPNLPECGDPLPIRGFVVTDGVLNFGTLRGPISADGTILADMGRGQVQGRFYEGGFDGQLIFRPICVRMMRLQRQ